MKTFLGILCRTTIAFARIILVLISACTQGAEAERPAPPAVYSPVPLRVVVFIDQSRSMGTARVGCAPSRAAARIVMRLRAYPPPPLR